VYGGRSGKRWEGTWTCGLRRCLDLERAGAGDVMELCLGDGGYDTNKMKKDKAPA